MVSRGVTNLKDVADLIMGQSPPGSTYNLIGDGLPFYQGASDFGRLFPSVRVYCSEPSRIANEGDILISVRAPIGRLNIALNTCALGRGVAAIRARKKNDQHYLRYALMGKNDYWRTLEAEGSVFGNASKSDLEELILEWPQDELIRAAIGSILGSLDDKIELNRQVNEKFEATAQAMFKSWFIDFDPVRAKAEGRDTGLPEHISSLFPASFIDSELGQIPEGWEVCSLSDLGEFLNGLALQKYPPKGKALPVIKIAQLRAGNIVGADQAGADIDARYIVEDGDLLFSWSGSLECVFWSGGKGALNQHLFKVSSSIYPRWLLYYGIHHHLPWFRNIAEGKATTMGHIQRMHLQQALLALPNQAIIHNLGKPISAAIDKIVTNSIESKKLALLRDTLLPNLISGELPIPDAERIVGRYL